MRIELQYRLFVALFFLVLIGFFIANSIEVSKEKNDFVKTEVNGHLLKLTKKSRGYSELTIEVDSLGHSLLITQYLFISGFIENNNIQEGDSISKEKNSSMLIFYKTKNKHFVKCCETKIF